jgi:DNA-binding CsgD family transcriptional regulator
MNDGGVARFGLVGRASELAAVDALLDGARESRSAALVLAGPPGIGKSALVRHAIERAESFRVLGATCVESEMAFGYAGVHQLVLPVLDGAHRLPGPQRLALDAALGRVQHGQPDPFLTGLAVLSLVAQAARSSPVLVVVDDAQWLDDESAVSLSFVARRLGAERVAMLVAVRDTPGGPVRFEGVDRLDLSGLPGPEATALLRSAAAGHVDDAVASRLVRATEGNPLALVELPAALTPDQLSGAAALPDPLPIGERLSALFTARVRALDGDARDVLLLAATERLGDPALLRRAAAASGVVEWDEAIARAEASGLVRFTPAVEFRHPLVRSAVYYSAEPAARRQAHASLAQVLDSDAEADRRAWHLGAAAAAPDEEVARALEASAERAQQRGGSSIAAAYLWRAAELTPDPGRAAERLLEAARAELVGGRASRAREMLERARTTGLSRPRHAEAAWTEALIHIVDGKVREAVALLADALPAAVADRPALALGSCGAAMAVMVAGAHLIEPSTRRTGAVGTLDVLRQGRIADPVASVMEGLGTGLDNGWSAAGPLLRDAVLAAAGDQARLQAVAGRSVHVVYFDAVMAAAGVLDDRAWEDLATAWVELSRRIGALGALPLALSLRSWLEVLQGRPGSAASHVAEIEEVVSLTGSRGLLGVPIPAQVLRDAWQGDEEATRTGARRMMRDAHERGQGIAVDQAHLALTVLALGAARYEDALREALHVYEHDSISVGTQVLADLVEAAVRCREPEIAERALERLAERSAALGTPWASGLLARARGLAASGDEAEEHFRVALDSLSSGTIATDLARSRLAYGEWLRRSRRRKDARTRLHEALELFETIGASGFAQRARTELGATGEHVRHRSAPVDVLTPQEAQIARLAASGHRNHEIAAELYISTSTVEYHLRKIFVKLGVTSRTQLAQVDLPA